ncbi:MAG: FAD binding domain-containing protein [Candidatus Izimaplasma sp.]|nr:FAD binding domain-containing protein [Candidatus Izimaplasma bacterium]
MEIVNYFKPKTIEEAYKKLQEDPSNLIIGGGAWLRLSSKIVNTAIDLEYVGLNQIKDNENSIEIDAYVTLREVEKFEPLANLFSGIVNKGVNGIMAVALRNLVTVGGSIAGKYSFSDFITPLLAVNTEVVMYKAGKMSLEEFLKFRSKEKDIILKIIIKKEEVLGYYYKMKKTGLDFAVINVGITNTAGYYKIVIGARPSLSAFAVKAMEYINSQKEITEEVIKETSKIAIEELKFGTNSKASKEYRIELAKVYVKRGLKEVTK